MNPPRVLILISSTAMLGAERVVVELCRMTDPSVATLHLGLMSQNEELLEQFRTEIRRNDISSRIFKCNGRISISCALDLASYLQRNRIDIIHSHNYKSDIYAAFASSLSHKPVKLLASSHNWMTGSPLEKFYMKLDLLILRSFDRIIAISPAIKQTLLKSGVHARSIQIIHNGIDPGKPISDHARMTARRQLGLGDNELVVGCVASLTPEKAHTDLIRAFHALTRHKTDARLVLIGEGRLRTRIESCSAAFNLEQHMLLTGKRDDVREIYPAFDIFMLTSHTEGLPMAMLEAMASGLPVVVPKVGAIPAVISDGHNGILVEPGDICGEANALYKLVNNQVLRQSLATNARKTVVSQFSSQRMAGQYEEIYKTLGGTA